MDQLFYSGKIETQLKFTFQYEYGVKLTESYYGLVQIMVSNYYFQIYELLILNIQTSKINLMNLDADGYNKLLELRDYYEKMLPS